MVSSVVWAEDGAQATPQSAVSPATAQAQTTTTLVPQNQVVYETVYDVETVQVPVTSTRRSIGPSTRPRLFR